MFALLIRMECNDPRQYTCISYQRIVLANSRNNAFGIASATCDQHRNARKNMSFFRLLPKEANYVIVPLMFLSGFGYWMFEGNMSSTTVSFDPDSGHEAEKRSQLPEYFLPVHEASRMIQLEDEDRQKGFCPEMNKITALFDMPVVASTVHDFYSKNCPKGLDDQERQNRK